MASHSLLYLIFLQKEDWCAVVYNFIYKNTYNKNWFPVSMNSISQGFCPNYFALATQIPFHHLVIRAISLCKPFAILRFHSSSTFVLLIYPLLVLILFKLSQIDQNQCIHGSFHTWYLHWFLLVFIGLPMKFDLSDFDGSNNSLVLSTAFAMWVN